MKKFTRKSLISLLSLSILAGNLSPYIANAQETQNPTLTVTPKPIENYVQLDWSMADKSQPYSYQIKQIKEGSAEPQSIQAKENVKVLNVYPGQGASVTYTTWNGETKTVPQSASLERWMEEPNAENSKGYGMGLIDVDNAKLSDFNANPNQFLKDASGNWKYDAVFFGSWDCNGICNQDGDLTIESAQVVKALIENGRGALFGHDTIIGSNAHPNFNSLRSYLNIKTSVLDGLTINSLGSKRIKTAKKGLLTNYPWQIGEIGSFLSVPYTHSTQQVTLGEVWMAFDGYTDPTYNTNMGWNGPDVSDKEGKGTNNFYLSTWNNTAMIQTGHSNGAGTPDEQKILANTLFYLSQITTNTSWTDRSGQDLKAPNVPTIQGASYNKSTGNLQFSYQAVVDNGSTYTYQVEATGQNDGVKSLSEQVSATITSGLKGYSIVVDANPSTVPDLTIETSNSTYSMNKPYAGDFYIHVGAVDNQGNISVAHYKVDTASPEQPLLTATPSSPTNGKVVVSASFASTSVTKLIKVGENGTWVNYTTPITLNSNTNVYAKGIDSAGNESAVSTFAVNNIDRNAPTVQSIRQNISTPTNQDVTITVTGADAEFGVKRMYKPEAGSQGLQARYYTHTTPFSTPPLTKNGLVYQEIVPQINYDFGSGSPHSSVPTDYFTIEYSGLIYIPETGTYTFQSITDDGVRLMVDNQLIIDKWLQQSPTAHQGSISLQGGKWYPIQMDYYENSGGATAKLYWKYGSMTSFEIIPTNRFMPFGESAEGNSINKTVTENGSHLFVIEDYAGNRTLTEATVSNIDKVEPLKPTLSANTVQPTNGSVTVTATYPSDVIKGEVRVNGVAWTTYSSPVVLTGNGYVEARGYDQAGNISEVTRYDVTNIDKTPPSTPVLTPSTSLPTNQDVTVSITYPSDAVSKEYRVNNGTWIIYKVPVVVTQNGKVEARATDEAGNLSAVGSYTVTNIDKVAPESPQFSASKTTPTNTDVAVTVTFPADASIKQVRVNGGAWFSYTVPVTFSDNGLLEARSIDAVGNVSAVSSYQVTNIDKVAPVTPSLSADKTYSTNTNVLVIATFSNDAVKKEYRMNNGTWSVYSSPIVMTENGKVEVRGTDEAGNVSGVATYEVTNIDKTPPSSPILSADISKPTNTDVKVTIVYPSDAHVKEYRIENGAWTVYTSSIVLTNNAKVEARAKDIAGNFSTIGSYTVSNIDKTAPDSPLLVADKTESTNSAVKVTVTYSSDAYVKQVRINDGSWTSYVSPVSLSENGKVEARSIDEAGNFSAVASYEVKNIDKVAPSVPSYEIMPHQNAFSLTGEQGASHYYQVNNSEWRKYESQVTMEDGVYEIRFKSIDPAGNESDSSAHTTTMYRNALLVATSSVEKAEKEPVQENVDSARSKVKAIPQSAPEYQPLMKRLDDLQALLDAQKAIQVAIDSRNDADVQLAKEKISLLNNSNPVILDLMDEIEVGYEEAEILNLVAKERYDILSSKHQMSKDGYTALVNIYYAIKYTGDFMYKYAEEKVALVPVTDKHYGFVQTQLVNLKEDYTQFVDTRTQTDAYNKALSSVQVMEGKYDPSLAVNTQNLINAVEDPTQRAELQTRLDNAKAKYEASMLSKTDQDAILAVEKAEQYRSSYYVSEAYKKVNYLTNAELKFELTNRLQQLEADMALQKQVSDATKSVQLAEQYPSTTTYLTTAQTKVSALPDVSAKGELQARIDKLKAGLDQTKVVKDANSAVSLAQSMRTQYYVDKARVAISLILDEVIRMDLSKKVDAILIK